MVLGDRRLPLLDSGDLKYYVPNQVNTSLKFETIESARVTECGLTAGGDPYCWGVNGAGEVGTTPIGSTFRFDTPVARRRRSRVLPHLGGNRDLLRQFDERRGLLLGTGDAR